MKRRKLLIPIVFLIVSPTLFAAELNPAPVIISVQPSLDIPLLGDNELFTLGMGVEASVACALPFWPLLCLGMECGYHFAPLVTSELGGAGLLSLISGSVLSGFRFAVLRWLELCLCFSGGYYYAFLSDDPSATGHNFYVGGGAGLSLPALSLGLNSRYTNFLGLYHNLAVILSLDIRLER